MTRAYESRIRDHRRRVLVRSWEYRQRNHAHGTWFRLRRAPSGRIPHVASARPIDVRLSAELLSAECLALTPFDELAQ